MRRITTPVGFAACACLLALQWSGLHMHADDHGFTGAPQSASSHSHIHHDHGSDRHGAPTDHEDAHDVSLLDLAAGTFKLTLAALTLAFLFAVFPRIATLASADIVFPVLSGRHTRWRPPLRAPPLSA